ncbi:MAG: Nif3-like dinuclear metal center hexameric protein [Flavobacteriales bacterium]
MKLHELTDFLDRYAPPAYQEDFDNSGLLVGEPDTELKGVLITLDCTEATVDEAIERGVDVIVAHHPVIFASLKSLTGKDHVERTVMKALRNGIAIYATHTNLDKVHYGVNARFAEKLGLHNLRVLSPMKGHLTKLVVFCPTDRAEEVRHAIFQAGGGTIGAYSQCSFNAEGFGTFKASNGSDPYVGRVGEEHRETELRIETVFPAHLEGKVIERMKKAHPYEEVAFDLYPLSNEDPFNGFGMVGEMEKEWEETAFLERLKERMKTGCVRHSPLLGQKVKRVAICGGAGRFLMKDALKAGADAFVTADMKYHEFFDAEGRILIADIGHYESEQYTVELLAEVLQAEFPKFAVLSSKVNTNPVNYF